MQVFYHNLRENNSILPQGITNMKNEEKQHLLDSDYQSGTLSLELEKENVDTDDDPIQNRKLENPTSNFDTLIHLLKGNVGTGILAMPDAFRNAGWVVGVVGTLFMGLICTHCMHILIKCAHELCRRTGKPFMDFSQVAENAFQTGPESLQKYSRFVRIMVNTFLCITQLGFCCVYFVFVAANLQEVVKHYLVDINFHWYLLMLLVPMIFLNWVKSLKYLAPVSLLASVLTTIGLAITFLYMLQGLPSMNTVKAFSSWAQLPLYFGTAIFAFEGIGVILPLENNMKTPQDFIGWNGVLNTGMVIVACLYTAVGFFGYLKYGELAVLGSVTLYLPANDFLAQSVRLMMAVAIFLSYGLQFYVPFNIVWPIIKRWFHTEEITTIAEYTTRTLLVFVTFALGIIIPNLGAVISLVGAFSSSALAIIFPPIIEIVVFWPKDFGKNNWILWKDIAITIFGLIGFHLGTYVSVLNVINLPEA